VPRPARRLHLDALEDRAVPAVWNNPWADSGNLTISFAPEGTPINGVPSKLYQELGPATAAWRGEILRAFQTWGAQVNINVSVVADGGAPFGTPGPTQGDARHGDIRIGARSLGATELAISTPFDLFGGWSGEVVLNTDKAFNLSGSGAYDLYTVFLQESGHVLGLPNSTQTSSVMYTTYISPRAGLSTSDLTNIRNLYGVREPDRLEGLLGNSSLLTATKMSVVGSVLQLAGLDGTLGLVPFVAAGDLTTTSDVDLYQVVTTSSTQLKVCLRTSEISLLKARVTLINLLGQTMATSVATDPMNGDITLTANSILPVGTYFVKVEKAANDVFAIGSYRLAIGAAADQVVHDPILAGLLQADDHQNDQATSATNLGNQRTSSDQRWDFTTRAVLSDSTDVDWYRVKSGTNPGVLVVAVWGEQAGGVDPLVSLYDENQQPVAIRVLSNDDGTMTLQASAIAAYKTYYIRVAGDPSTGSRAGNYFLGAEFRSSGIESQRLAEATLTQQDPQAATTMTVYQSQLFHFALSTTTANSQVSSAMRISVYDHKRNEVFTLFTVAGGAVSGDVLLAAGTYTIIFTAGTPEGSWDLPALSFTLDGMVRSDPIGAQPTNTSGSPSGSSSTAPSSTPTTKYNGPYTEPYRPS
jgi:hypothetical protein